MEQVLSAAAGQETIEQRQAWAFALKDKINGNVKLTLTIKDTQEELKEEMERITKLRWEHITAEGGLAVPCQINPS